VSGSRKGHVTGRGSFLLRGQRLSFDVTLVPPAEKQPGQLWLSKASLKGPLVDASFDGSIDVSGDLTIAGHSEFATRNLRKIVRAFGVPVPLSKGLNAVSLKGQCTWAHGTIAVEKARVTVDGSEASGTVAFSYGGEHPTLDGTLAFNSLDLSPYFEALRSQSYVFDRHTWSWSAFDFSFPILNHFDADLRLSAAALGFDGNQLGRGAASISVRSGKLIANIAELELATGTASGRLTADMTEFVPRYALRGKVDNFEPAAATAVAGGVPMLSGRSALKVELKAAGQTPTEVLRSLSGKIGLSLSESGKLGVDVRAMRAAADASLNPGQLLKAATSIDTLEARASVVGGVVVGEQMQAKTAGLNISASGSADLLDRTLDLRLTVAPAAAADKSPEAAATVLSVSGPWNDPLVRRAPPVVDPPAP
jgi:AsmA protein